jgi:methionyl-tRNA formyltransferase
LNKEQLRIIFLGTPAFAVATLNAIVQATYNVVAVVTAPDKPAGRGMHLQQSEVKQYAIANNIPVLQPVKLKDEQFLNELASYKANVQVVVAFRMLPVAVWDMPAFGTYNVHASLLPKYRGAAPINWAIINGDTHTGVTTFKLVHAIDKGDIVVQQAIDILPSDNAGTMHDKLMHLGAIAMLQTLEMLSNETIKYISQSDIQASHAPKLFTETCLINWNDTAINIVNKIRGLSPYPAAFTTINNKKVKIFEAEVFEQDVTYTNGWYSNNKNCLVAQCNNGGVSIKSLQPEGKKKLSINEYLNGNKL